MAIQMQKVVNSALTFGGVVTAETKPVSASYSILAFVWDSTVAKYYSLYCYDSSFKHVESRGNGERTSNP